MLRLLLNFPSLPSLSSCRSRLVVSVGVAAAGSDGGDDGREAVGAFGELVEVAGAGQAIYVYERTNVYFPGPPHKWSATQERKACQKNLPNLHGRVIV